MCLSIRKQFESYGGYISSCYQHGSGVIVAVSMEDLTIKEAAFKALVSYINMYDIIIKR